jgi:hypothetical protein
MDMLKTKLEELATKLGKIPDEFWVRLEGGGQVIWLLDQEDGTAGSYETSQERIGMTRKGKIIWGFSSGCSCWDGWDSSDYCPTKNTKEFEVDIDFASERKVHEELIDWEKPLLSTLDSFLLMVSDDVDPKKVLEIENAEIRRYMIKRIGYEKIKDSVKAVVLHVDGNNELLKFENGEMYVKVRDSSTEREYLLFVEREHKTCRSAIAWTFGLKEEQYQPLIET